MWVPILTRPLKYMKGPMSYDRSAYGKILDLKKKEFIDEGLAGNFDSV